MSNKVLSLLATLAIVAASSFASIASAATANPAANFTLRSSSNAGPAAGMDSTWSNGGFEGFLTNLEGGQVDRTYLEYDLSVLSGPVTSASLNFNMSGSAADIVSMSWYAANGVAEMAEWFTALIPVTTFGAGNGSYAIDITALINANLNLPFIGFAFSIDGHPNQAFFSMDAPPQLNYTPEPGSLALLGLALAAAALSRRRQA